MKDLTIGEKIGHGGQAEVFKAKYGLDVVVIKIFSNSEDKDWRREVDFAKQVRYRHIVQFYNVEHNMLMMEYVEGGSLSNAILEGSIKDWETKTRIAKQVSMGLSYIHGQNILHCDIKSSNVLLTKGLDAKICDFGRARTAGQGGRDGTLPWMAPELLLEPPQYSCKSDVYALGMVMWEMASGCNKPYQEHLQGSMILCIVNGITEDIPSNTPEAYRACIQICWHKKPEERPTAAEILPDVNSMSQNHDIGEQMVLEDEQDRKASVYSSVGSMYHSGFGIRKKDYKKSMEWYLKASDDGDAGAKFAIGMMYHSGGYGVEQDYTKAMEWYLKASDAGDLRAKFNIGMMYVEGHGVGQDYAEAIKWYLEASDTGDPGVMLNIGSMYDRGGYGVEQDYAKAIEWYLKASDAGDPDAKFNIGVMYESGFGVGQDYAKAMEWYLKASDAGDPVAMLSICVMYGRGYGVGQDYTEAMKWYLKAIDAGYSSTKVNYGQRHRDDLRAGHKAMHCFSSIFSIELQRYQDECLNG
ncbi:hypothetical protein BGZ99_004850 [Dissophora globulifera]|uniref:Protein kinase domain-containing protein n=1 Tax=Dissophora globulifera TaxID=979702 RepID=A0A9P6RL19_9FUNG|nr:hypothetical protein BGZ99_004850 [Dissophora globulifera]